MVILTDLSEVFISGIYGTEKILATKFGDEAGKLFWDQHNKTYIEFENLMRGRMTEKEYWDIFFKKGEYPFTYKDVNEAFAENLRKTIPDTADMYQRIISHPRHVGSAIDMVEGVPTIYLVSDHIRERIQFIKKSHKCLFKLFADEFWSFKIGKIKRDPGFFSNLLSKLNLRPEEVVFIDDSQVNINMATFAGVHSILFRNADQVENMLKNCYRFEFTPKKP